MVTAHVTRQGEIRSAEFGGWRESIDLETEEVGAGESARAIRTGLRLGIYSKESDPEYEEDGETAPMRVFRYGERLRFPAKLRMPRNFRNPGAFDYRGYLPITASWCWDPQWGRLCLSTQEGQWTGTRLNSTTARTCFDLLVEAGNFAARRGGNHPRAFGSHRRDARGAQQFPPARIVDRSAAADSGYSICPGVRREYRRSGGSKERWRCV